MRLRIVLGVWMVIAGGSIARADEPAATWKAGAARVKITPAKPMWMSGYASRTKPAEGTIVWTEQTCDKMVTSTPETLVSRMKVDTAMLIIVGLQIFFSSFLLSILGLRRRDSSTV